MGLFSFLQGVGRRLGLGTTATAAEAEKPGAAPTPAPSADMLQQELNRLGLPFAGMTLRVEDHTVVLEGTRQEAATQEKIVLALGNVAGIAQVDDRTTGATQAAAPESRFYTVKKGDTLSAISKAHYGDANAYMRIFEANTPMLEHPDRIYPGQVLRIPQ